MPLRSAPLRALALAWVWLASCTGSDLSEPDWRDVCIDLDHDGRGLQCAAGPDCDDRDETLWEGCGRCEPSSSEGCPCEDEGVTESCVNPLEVSGAGELLCEVGTRTCRRGTWSACENVEIKSTPAALAVRYRAEIARDAAPVACSPCHPDCYRVDDPLDPSDAGLGANIISSFGGGITLTSTGGDAGVAGDSAAPPPCVLGSAPDRDCDGIPDAYDPAPDAPPFATDNDAIFLDLAAGESKTRDFGLTFALNSADIYFYLDMTGSMSEERDQLIASLTSGNYLANGGAGMDCADRDFDGTPDNDLKDGGIAGNIACLIRDAQLGAGWFRDIPFYGPYAGSSEAVADTDFEPFEHRQDITSDVTAVRNALSTFTTRGNYNVPEGSMQGLWSLVTGSELYMGWDRPGIPARTGCAADRWGYPCFRTSSVPIIVHITDAPLQNGPSPTSAGRLNTLAPCMQVCGYFCSCDTSKPHPLNYDSSVLAGMRSGTDPHYRPLTASAETLTTFQDVGTINSALITYTGTTVGKTSDVTLAQTGSCPSGTSAWPSSNQGAPDLVFRFSVSSTKTLTISTRGSRFDTTLLVKKTTSSTPLTCADDIGGGLLTSEITRSFTAGDYLVVLKGYSASKAGMFQITFGDTALATTGAFPAKRWLGPAGDGVGGIRSALQARSAHVVTVNSSTDPYLAEQASELSSQTGATNAAGAPLVFNINSDGTGMGTAVVDAIDRLAGSLAMNVTPRLVESPDSPAPKHFTLSVQAIDAPGDGCEAPIDTDGDPAHLPDTHVACRPGANPHFRIVMGNPAAPNNVPSNPADPGGGYNMRMELIGDGQYVVDTIPVYVIPADVVPAPSPPVYAATGSYEQTAEASGCISTERAQWGPLEWDARVPAGTSILFEMCSADSAGAASGCSLTSAVHVTGGSACTTNAQCAGGYCANSGYCEYAQGPACTSSAACGAGGTCQSGTCRWAQASADLGLALALGQQGRPYLRTRVTLASDSTRMVAPTLESWRVRYTCRPSE